MIIEIKVANYRSINAEQTLSFVADRATRHPDNLIKRPGYRLLKAVGLFGANASGKSNFVKAVGAMRNFVLHSATRMNDGDNITAAEPHRLNSVALEQPSSFEITFLDNDTVYTYALSADAQRVYDEWLTATPKGAKAPSFSFNREWDRKNRLHGWSIQGADFFDFDDSIDRTRDNASFLSTAAKENNKRLLPVYRFIRDMIQVNDMSGPFDIFRREAAEECLNNPQLRDQVEGLLHDADTGIDSLRIENVGSSQKGLPTVRMPENAADLYKMLIQAFSGNSNIRITTSRHTANGDPINFDYDSHESIGTQRFFVLAVLLLNALKTGAFVAVDEIDASMHPLLTRKLLELFQSPSANPYGAQLLFTTHDPSLLDQELFRRDQVWLTEKRGGASTFFSLADIEPPVRNTESFLRNYLAGRYGGTPQLGGVLQSLDLGASK